MVTHNNIKICHITTVHKWDDNRIFQKECVSLSKAGFDVHLIAPNTEIKTSRGVNIHNITTHKGSKLKRIFMARRKALKVGLEIDAELYHLHDPELLLIADDLKRAGKKVIYDSHEDVPKQILYKNWLGIYIIRIIISFIVNKYEKKICSKIDGVISVIEEITEKFNTKNKITIKNYPNTDFIKHRKGILLKRENTIVYVGGLSKERGIKDYIKAMKWVPDQCKLVLVGNFISEEFYQECKALPEWSRVDYKGFLHIENVVDVLLSSKIGLCVLYPEKNYLNSLPTKGFEYMAASLPMVMSDFEYWRPYFNETAIMIEPCNPEKIGKSIALLIENNELFNSKKKACEHLIDNFSWRSQAELLINFYKKVLNDTERN